MFSIVRARIPQDQKPDHFPERFLRFFAESEIFIAQAVTLIIPQTSFCMDRQKRVTFDCEMLGSTMKDGGNGQ